MQQANYISKIEYTNGRFYVTINNQTIPIDVDALIPLINSIDNYNINIDNITRTKLINDYQHSLSENLVRYLTGQTTSNILEQPIDQKDTGDKSTDDYTILDDGTIINKSLPVQTEAIKPEAEPEILFTIDDIPENIKTKIDDAINNNYLITEFLNPINKKNYIMIEDNNNNPITIFIEDEYVEIISEYVKENKLRKLETENLENSKVPTEYSEVIIQIEDYINNITNKENLTYFIGEGIKDGYISLNFSFKTQNKFIRHFELKKEEEQIIIELLNKTNINPFIYRDLTIEEILGNIKNKYPQDVDFYYSENDKRMIVFFQNETIDTIFVENNDELNQIIDFCNDNNYKYFNSTETKEINVSGTLSHLTQNIKFKENNTDVNSQLINGFIDYLNEDIEKKVINCNIYKDEYIELDLPLILNNKTVYVNVLYKYDMGSFYKLIDVLSNQGINIINDNRLFKGKANTLKEYLNSIEINGLEAIVTKDDRNIQIFRNKKLISTIPNEDFIEEVLKTFSEFKIIPTLESKSKTVNVDQMLNDIISGKKIVRENYPNNVYEFYNLLIFSRTTKESTVSDTDICYIERLKTLPDSAVQYYEKNVYEYDSILLKQAKIALNQKEADTATNTIITDLAKIVNSHFYDEDTLSGIIREYINTNSDDFTKESSINNDLVIEKVNNYILDKVKVDILKDCIKKIGMDGNVNSQFGIWEIINDNIPNDSVIVKLDEVVDFIVNEYKKSIDDYSSVPNPFIDKSNMKPEEITPDIDSEEALEISSNPDLEETFPKAHILIEDKRKVKKGINLKELLKYLNPMYYCKNSSLNDVKKDIDNILDKFAIKGNTYSPVESDCNYVKRINKLIEDRENVLENYQKNQLMSYLYQFMENSKKGDLKYFDDDFDELMKDLLQASNNIHEYHEGESKYDYLEKTKEQLQTLYNNKTITKEQYLSTIKLIHKFMNKYTEYNKSEKKNENLSLKDASTKAILKKMGIKETSMKSDETNSQYYERINKAISKYIKENSNLDSIENLEIKKISKLLMKLVDIDSENMNSMAIKQEIEKLENDALTICAYAPIRGNKGNVEYIDVLSSFRRNSKLLDNKQRLQLKESISKAVKLYEDTLNGKELKFEKIIKENKTEEVETRRTPADIYSEMRKIEKNIDNIFKKYKNFSPSYSDEDLTELTTIESKYANTGISFDEFDVTDQAIINAINEKYRSQGTTFKNFNIEDRNEIKELYVMLDKLNREDGKRHKLIPITDDSTSFTILYNKDYTITHKFSQFLNKHRIIQFTFFAGTIATLGFAGYGTYNLINPKDNTMASQEMIESSGKPYDLTYDAEKDIVSFKIGGKTIKFTLSQISISNGELWTGETWLSEEVTKWIKTQLNLMEKELKDDLINNNVRGKTL